jgi:hypothetical protein
MSDFTFDENRPKMSAGMSFASLSMENSGTVWLSLQAACVWKSTSQQVVL